jgi:c(7)-type cytochrome triheme protein
MIQKGWKLFWGFALLAGMLVLVYACTRQQQKPDEASTKPAAPAAATPAIPVQPPAQAKESTAAAPLVAPNPTEPGYEDPTQLPVPGAPYGKDNRNADVVLKEFPRDAVGADDWVKAPVPPFNFDVEIPAVGAMPNVVFPHFPHTFWLDCGNCHPAIFQMKKGANPISMVKIVNGEFCGRCHGRIAFPLANCTRCHVKPKE